MRCPCRCAGHTSDADVSPGTPALVRTNPLLSVSHVSRTHNSYFGGGSSGDWAGGMRLGQKSRPAEGRGGPRAAIPSHHRSM